MDRLHLKWILITTVCCVFYPHIVQGTATLAALEEMAQNLMEMNGNFKELKDRMTSLELAVMTIAERRGGSSEECKPEKKTAQTNLTDSVKRNLCSDKNYVYLSNSCYYVSEAKTGWFSARRACLGLGGNLVKISNQDEFDFVKGHLNAEQVVWIGLSDHSNSGQFSWSVDTSLLTNDGWWSGGGPPKNYTSTEGCVQFEHSALSNHDCNDLNLYVCEISIWDI